MGRMGRRINTGDRPLRIPNINRTIVAMDDFDCHLREAWDRVIAMLRRDPEEAWRRAKRGVLGMYRYPPRAWCLAVRASDTRLERVGAVSIDWDASEGEHHVELTASIVKQLCTPVHLPYPGVTLQEAANRLGRHRESLRAWLPVKPGRTRAARAVAAPATFHQVVDPSCPLVLVYVKAQSQSHFGFDVPMVWSRRALNPGASRGNGPHALWGSLWTYVSESMLSGYARVIRRVPRMRPYRGGWRQRGWDWECPGLSKPCDRRVQTLYGPMTYATLGTWLPMSEPLAVRRPAEEAALRGLPREGLWTPGMLKDEKRFQGFACDKCWHVRGLDLASHRGWNDVVSYLSDGVLYGREVKQPDWFTPH